MPSLFWTFLLFLTIAAWALPWAVSTGVPAQTLAFGLVGIALLAGITRANGSLWGLFRGTLRIGLSILGLVVLWRNGEPSLMVAVLILAVVTFGLYLMFSPMFRRH